MDPLKNFVFADSPFKNFDKIYSQAINQKLPDPNAMNLATISSEGRPTVRVVYFKEFYGEGFGFFTNYQGRKGREIATNPNVSCNFFWSEMHAQVRVDGWAEKLTRIESEEYFRTRARLSQLGAWASNQSSEIADHAELESRLAEFEKKFEGVEVPCPPHWGGYRIMAREIEFWFGMSGRLHYRYIYSRKSPESFAPDRESVLWHRSMRNP